MVLIGSHRIFVNLNVWRLWSRPRQTSVSLRNYSHHFDFIAMMTIEPPAPIGAVLAVAVNMHFRRFLFWKFALRMSYGAIAFVFGAPLSLHLPHALQTSWCALAMFLLYEAGHTGSLTSLFTSTSWYIVTGVLLLLLLVWRVLLPCSTYMWAQALLEICLLVFLS